MVGPVILNPTSHKIVGIYINALTGHLVSKNLRHRFSDALIRNPPDTNAEFFRIRLGSFPVFAIPSTPTTRSFASARSADFKLAHYPFFAALIFAQRARCAAAILFLPAADILRVGRAVLFCAGLFPVVACTLQQPDHLTQSRNLFLHFSNDVLDRTQILFSCSQLAKAKNNTSRQPVSTTPKAGAAPGLPFAS